MNLETMHGLLLVNKTSGCTSHDVVKDVRKILYSPSVGHCGTLDPLASGLMVILIGSATRLSQYILEEDKGYALRVKFGVRTDTQDITGKVLSEQKVQLDLDKVQDAIEKLTGEINLRVPIYSAVKIKGKKLYEYARSQIDVEVPSRAMNFYDVKMVDHGSDWVGIEMKCSKGSYVRAWAAELGEILGCGAAVSTLCRTYSAPYKLENAITVDELKDYIKEGNDIVNHPSFTKLTEMLPELRTVTVQNRDLSLLVNGHISHNLRRDLISGQKDSHAPHVKILSPDNKKLLALVGIEKEKGFVIKNVFN